MSSPRFPSRSAFTLIELLVVMAVIAIFIGVFSGALRPGSPTVAVEGGQSTVAALLSQARGVAVLKDADTFLIIHADPDDPDRFLRFASIIYDANEDGDNDWTTDFVYDSATDGVSLSNGVYFVPPDGSLSGEVEFSDDPTPWDSAVNSSFSNGDAVLQVDFLSNEPEDYFFVHFNRRGLVPQTATRVGSPIISVATAQPAGDGTGLRFDNAAVARGAIVRQYGSFVLLNDTDEFPTP